VVATSEEDQETHDAQARACIGASSGDSEIVLTDEQIEEAVGIVYSFLNDEDKFREVGVAMNVLPSPPWDPALEESSSAADPTARYGDKDLDSRASRTAADGDAGGLRRSRRISFWGKKVSRESYLRDGK
jgi:hypothetical protein